MGHEPARQKGQKDPMVVREGTPDDRRKSWSMADATAATTSSSAAGGNGSGNDGRNDSRSGVRLRRGSTSFDEHRNSFSSIVSHNAANNSSGNMYDRANSTGSPAAAYRRHSSNFSDYSQDARDLLNPKPLDSSNDFLKHDEPTSSYDSLPLAFALLPAVGGLLFQGGDSFVTDLMLLGLGGIFLHWSVTQPWAWYHSSQQIRIEHEQNAEYAVQLDSDTEDDGDDNDATSSPLEDLHEEDEEADSAEKDGEAEQDKAKKPKRPTPDERVAAFNKKQREKRRQDRKTYQLRQDKALKELFRHEVLALLSCFLSPIIGAYLLHALRNQLTRPSEGLVSNFNLAVFILAAEVRPLRHFLQLVQARTLHLQRIVHANPYREEEERYRERREQEELEQNQQLADLLHRFETLEQQTATAIAAANAAATAATPSAKSASNHHTSSTTSYFPSSPSPPSPLNGFAGTPDDNNRSGGGGSRTLHHSPSTSKRDRDQIMREVRAQMQPELDTLARALRRTHKQQALLEGQVVAKFRTTDQRLTDAMSLASAAASTGRTPFGGRRRLSNASGSASLSPAHLAETVWGTVIWASEGILEVLLFVPRCAMMAAASIVTLPLWAMQTTLSAVGLGGSHNESSQTSGKDEKASREGKSGRSVGALSTSSTTVVDGSLRLGKNAGADTKIARDQDYEYSPMPTSKSRQNRFGLS